MKTFLLLALSLLLSEYSSGQIICIMCYDQNDSISSGVTNLLVNGGLESSNCTPNTNASSFCPNSVNYNCTLLGWTCTGGGLYTYASVWNNQLTTVPQGLYTIYFGNDFCKACGPISNDTSCLNHVDCTVTGTPPGYPQNAIYYGGPMGVILSQTVSGLTIGDTYVLEFWTGGEDFGSFIHPGIFGVDVGFGDTLLNCKATDPGDTGRVYIIEFKATATSQTIKFTNWGHICNDCTELILDNVRLYTLAELSPSVSTCGATSSSTAFAVSDTAVCQKFCVSYSDQSGNNPSAWQWYFPGGDPSSSTSQNPGNICYDTPGIFDVTLITTNGAGNDTLIQTNYITVYATPPVSGHFAGGI